MLNKRLIAFLVNSTLYNKFPVQRAHYRMAEVAVHNAAHPVFRFILIRIGGTEVECIEVMPHGVFPAL